MRRRLIGWLTGCTILFWLVASGLGAYVMRDEFWEVFDSALQETAQRLLPLVVDDLRQKSGSLDAGGVADKDQYVTYQLRDAGGAVLLHSHNAPAVGYDTPLRRGFSNTEHHRVYTEQTADGALFLQVADRLDHRREALVEGALSLLLPVILLIPLSMATIWYLVSRSLKPLGVLRAEIGARDGVNLWPIAIDELPPELETISVSVNRLLERLRVALEAERQFAANSAHELRTPIAGALAQTQRLMAELPAGRAHDRAAAVEQALMALGGLTEKLLQLSRAESGIGTAVASIDIVPVVELVVEDFGRLSQYGERISLDRADVPTGAAVVRPADIDALGIVLRNLIENAFAHGSRDGPVRVTVFARGAITVSNDGDAVPPDLLSHLKERFNRGATSVRGSGLGLAIADTLARQMGATLTLTSPAPGSPRGFVAELRWSESDAGPD